MADEYVVSGWAKLGAVLRDTRRAKGLTQAETATRAEVSRSWLARVEAGHRGAEVAPLLRLLAALDLTLAIRASDSAATELAASEDWRAAAQARRDSWRQGSGQAGASDG